MAGAPAQCAPLGKFHCPATLTYFASFFKLQLDVDPQDLQPGSDRYRDDARAESPMTMARILVMRLKRDSAL